GEDVVWTQLDGVRVDPSEPHLGTRQVGHDGYATTGRSLRRSDALDALRMPGKVPVRKIDPGDVHPGTDEPLEGCGRVGGRPDGGNDLRLALGKRHRSARHPHTTIRGGSATSRVPASPPSARYATSSATRARRAPTSTPHARAGNAASFS